MAHEHEWQSKDAETYQCARCGAVMSRDELNAWLTGRDRDADLIWMLTFLGLLSVSVGLIALWRTGRRRA